MKAWQWITLGKLAVAVIAFLIGTGLSEPLNLLVMGAALGLIIIA